MARTTTRSRRVATAVPLALVSVAWTTHVAGPPTLTASAPATSEPQPQPQAGVPFGPTAIIPFAQLKARNHIEIQRR